MKETRLRRGSWLLAEIGVIVFSVLLALAANEWRQSRARAATVATVRETIRAEALANREQLTRALEHHRNLVAQLREGGVELARISVAAEGIDTTSAAAVARTVHAAAIRRGAPPGAAFEAERLPGGDWRIRHDEAVLRLTIRGDTAMLRGVGNISLQPAFLIDSAWETAQITQAAVHMDPQLVASLARVRQFVRLVDDTVSRLIDILYGGQAGGDMNAALNDLAMFEQNLLNAYDDLLGRL